jgi:hypothetical protein
MDLTEPPTSGTAEVGLADGAGRMTQPQAIALDLDAEVQIERVSQAGERRQGGISTT